MYNIKAIIYAKAKTPEFLFKDDAGNKVKGYSSSIYIQSTLLNAFVGDNKLDLEFEADRLDIHKVKPYYTSPPKSRNYNGGYTVERVATQRNDEGEDHLEVFIKNKDNAVFPCNVDDVFLLNFLMTSITLSSIDLFNLNCEIEDHSILSASIVADSTNSFS